MPLGCLFIYFKIIQPYSLLDWPYVFARLVLNEVRELDETISKSTLPLRLPRLRLAMTPSFVVAGSVSFLPPVIVRSASDEAISRDNTAFIR